MPSLTITIERQKEKEKEKETKAKWVKHKKIKWSLKFITEQIIWSQTKLIRSLQGPK